MQSLPTVYFNLYFPYGNQNYIYRSISMPILSTLRCYNTVRSLPNIDIHAIRKLLKFRWPFLLFSLLSWHYSILFSLLFSANPPNYTCQKAIQSEKKSNKKPIQFRKEPDLVFLFLCEVNGCLIPYHISVRLLLSEVSFRNIKAIDFNCGE